MEIEVYNDRNRRLNRRLFELLRQEEVIEEKLKRAKKLNLDFEVKKWRFHLIATQKGVDRTLNNF